MWWLVAASLAAPLSDVVSSGDCATALSMVSRSEATAPERLAMGWCATRQGKPTEALSWLEGLDGPLAPYAHWQRAKALVALSRFPEAEAELTHTQALPKRLQDDLGVLRFSAHDLHGEDIIYYLEAFEGPTDPEVDLAAALRLAEDGARDQAVVMLRNVWEDATPGGHDARAAAALEGLGAAPIDGSTPDGRRSVERRIASLEKAYRNAEALALHDALSDGVAPTTMAGQLALARRRSKARDHAGALALWPQFMGPPDQAKGSAQHLFDYALTHARTGDYATAATIYRRVMAQHPGTKQAEFASFKLGYMSWDEGSCDEAVQRLDAHLKAFPSTKHLDESLWFRARCHWVSERPEQAVTDFKELLKRGASSSLAPGAAYWIAVHQLATDEPGGRAALQSVVNRWPVSGYAWFAAARLGTTFPAAADATPPPLGDLAKLPPMQRAQALLSAGLDPWARAELASVKATTNAQKLALAWVHLEAGDAATAKKLACPQASKPWKEGNAVAKQACTPRPERRLVEAVAARHGLDPSIPFGVMVAESALRPEVTSPAGARGLMQLMPEVARGLHPTLFPGRPFDPDDLYIAPYNAALGTEELGQRTDSLRGLLSGTDVPAVVASYNGGEDAVRRWAESQGETPMFDAWAESISYTETRRYVKRVLGHAMAVRWVYGDAASK